MSSLWARRNGSMRKSRRWTSFPSTSWNRSRSTRSRSWRMKKWNDWKKASGNRVCWSPRLQDPRRAATSWYPATADWLPAALSVWAPCRWSSATSRMRKPLSRWWTAICKESISCRAKRHSRTRWNLKRWSIREKELLTNLVRSSP